MSVLEHRFGPYGGQYVPETMMPALVELEDAWIGASSDPAFQKRLANLLRHYRGTQGRDVRLEHGLQDGLDRSSCLLECGLVAPASSPSQQATRREQAALLADALARLPDDYREALVLRHLEGLTFPEVARRTGRSLDSVEKLWLRALARLRQEFGGAP